MRHTTYAGARPTDFAHLMGAPAGKSRAEKDETDEARAAKARKAKRAAEDKRRAEEDQKRKDEDARRAEEDGVDADDAGEIDDDDMDADQEPDCPECDGSGEDDDGTTCDLCGGDGKVHVDDQPQEVDDMDGTDDAKGKKAERSRWTKVLGHKAAQGRVAAACSMLANSDMNAKAVVATLQTLPQQGASGGGLRDRMAAERPRNPGPNATGKAMTEGEAFAAEVAAASKKARGER